VHTGLTKYCQLRCKKQGCALEDERLNGNQGFWGLTYFGARVLEPRNARGFLGVGGRIQTRKQDEYKQKRDGEKSVHFVQHKCERYCGARAGISLGQRTLDAIKSIQFMSSWTVLVDQKQPKRSV
jgi:hypothetical protein